MDGLMMSTPLQVMDIMRHAASYHSQQQVVSRCDDGQVYHFSYAQIATRTAQLAHALAELGVEGGDRVATLAWNTHRHLELYYAVAGLGAIVHTINPRLFIDQISYIIRHAEDKVICVDLSLVPILLKLTDRLQSVQAIIVLCEQEQLPETELPLLAYEALLQPHSTEYPWPRIDESSACALCYTSGTTGEPKGVLYSHRSTVLHAMAGCTQEGTRITSMSCVLPVVPMFHVCAWGVPYSTLMSGAKLVLPGSGLNGKALYQLIDDEQVSLMLGVPTIWQALLDYLEESKQVLTSVKEVVIGGAAAPLSMIQRFQEQHDVYVIHAWGMTELSPLGTVNAPTQEILALPLEQRYQRQLKQGRPVFGVQIALFDDQDQALPHDGKTFGRLMVRGPWVAVGYYHSDSREAWVDGWFDTGDVATVDPEGYMQIVDRNKDVIKSGGEWISSVELENQALGHPAVKEACAVGIPHPKWDERPLLLVMCYADRVVDAAALKQYLQSRVAKWWVPDDIIFVTELPHTATGKLQKNKLRQQYGDHYQH